MIIPNVIDQGYRTEHFYDIYSRLLKERIIMLSGEIEDNKASLIIAQLLYLDSINKEDIQFYINSPGGSVTAGLAIYDTMQVLHCKVSTIAIGMAASMAAILVCGGANGKRYALPHSEFMLHQPLGGIQGPAADIEIVARQILKTKAQLQEILQHHTKKGAEILSADMERDYYLNAKEAKAYGLIDEIINTPH